MTTRELEILRLLGAGKSNKEIAAELPISERTARTHVSNILAKLKLTSRTHAAVWAFAKVSWRLAQSKLDRDAVESVTF